MRVTRSSVGAAAMGLTIVGCASLLGDFDVGVGEGGDGGDGTEGGSIAVDAAGLDGTTTRPDGAIVGSLDGAAGDATGSADATPVCTSDVCACPDPATTLCNQSCLALGSDNAHCGTSCATAVSCSSQTVCTKGTCAACVAPTKYCAGACVDFTTDGANCGSCGHSCGGGKCSGGVCQAVQIGGGLSGTLPSLVAVSGALFGTFNDGGGTGQLFRIALPGAPSTAAPPLVSKVSGPLGKLFFDGVSLWFGNTSTPASIYSAKITDLGNPVRATYASGSGTISNLAALDGHPYWDQLTGSIYQQLGAAMATPVSITPSTTRAIGGDQAGIYWAKAGGAIFAGHGDLTVAANNATIGNSPTSVAFDRMATDAKNVYFGDGDGLYRLPKSGAPMTTAYFTSNNGEPAQAFAPDPDDAVNRIYYMAIDPSVGSAKTIFAVAKDGTNNTAVKVTTLTGAATLSALAVDAAAIYYTTTAGEIWKLAK